MYKDNVYMYGWQKLEMTITTVPKITEIFLIILYHQIFHPAHFSNIKINLRQYIYKLQSSWLVYTLNLDRSSPSPNPRPNYHRPILRN